VSELDVAALLEQKENLGLRLLSAEGALPKSWTVVAGEYARAGRIDQADEILNVAVHGKV
jgi:hypothetical protein